MRRSALHVLALAFAASLTPASAHEATNNGVTVAHPWARATPGGSTIGVAYLEIKTAAGVADRLVSVASPAAGRAELHTHIMDGDVMRMRRVDEVALKPGAEVVFGPHGNHVMLIDLKAPLKEGDLIKLTLNFEKAGAIDVEATVEPIGAMGPHGMDHQPGHEGAAAGHSAHKH
jgi:periplasmic copper chaperone A